ncbi:MAG: aldolase/citrate lyase family protein [Caldilineaceae bacterium]
MSMGKQKIATNPVLDKLRSGEPAVGAWLSLASPVAAEAMAHIGWDWLTVDTEHSPVGFETMVNCFRAAQLGGAVPMARVPWNDIVWIQRTLDAGALGLVVPMVNTREDAQHVVDNMKYAVRGQRSFGGSRVASYIDGDYRFWADENIAVMVMIETVEAVENAEAILSVEGVDGCFIGPNDLALSMGLTFKDMGGEAHEAAMARVLQACRNTGKAAGKHCYNGAEVTQRIQQGFQYLALSSDAGLLLKGAREEFAAIDRSGAPASAAASTKGSLY